MKTYKTKIRGHFITLSHHPLVSLISLCLCVSVFNSSAQTQKTWQWVKQLGGDSWDISAGVACDSKNNLYVAGSFYNTLQCGSKKVKSSGNQDVFVARFSEDGDLKDLWACGGRGREVPPCLCTAPGDNIVIGGLLTDTATFGKVKATGAGQQLFVANLDNKGKFSWVTTFTTTGDASLYMMGADGQGTVYASGIFTGTLAGGGQKVTSNGKKDIFLVRINKSGAVEKLSSFGSTEDDAPGSLTVDGQGNVTLAGSFGKPFDLGGIKLSPGPDGTKTNTFLTFLNKDFTTQWAQVLPGDDYCQVTSLVNDKQGNLYVAGSFSAKLHVADTVFISKGYTDAFLLRYNPDGKLLWGKSFGSWYYDYANHMNLDNLGGVMVTGSMGDTMEVDTVLVTPKTKDNAALVVQFSPRGKAIWGDCISGSGRNFSDGSVLDKKGNLYLSGSFRNMFEKGSDALTSYGDQDVFLAKYYNCPTGKAEVFGQRAFCPGMGTELSIARGFKDVVWNDTIAGTSYITADKPGRYWVSMYDSKGCLLSDTLDITQAPSPVFSLGSDTLIRVTDSLLLKAPLGYTQYRWYDYSFDLTHFVKSADGKTGTENYWLTVTDSLNCSFTDTIVVTYVKAYNWVDLNNIQLMSYPNPVSDRVYWYVKTDEPCQLTAELADENGRVLYHQYFDHYLPGEVKEVYMGNVPVGPYYIRISGPDAGKGFKTLRVIKQ